MVLLSGILSKKTPTFILWSISWLHAQKRKTLHFLHWLLARLVCKKWAWPYFSIALTLEVILGSRWLSGHHSQALLTHLSDNTLSCYRLTMIPSIPGTWPCQNKPDFWMTLQILRYLRCYWKKAESLFNVSLSPEFSTIAMLTSS